LIGLTDIEQEAFDALNDIGQARVLKLLREAASEAAYDSFEDYCVFAPLPEVPDNARPAAHHKLLINALQDVEAGKIKNLMVFMPPGNAKSTYGSIAFPTWFLGRNRGKRIITASHNGELAEFFGDKCRGLVGSDEYGEIFSCGLSKTTKSKSQWDVVRGRTQDYYSGYYGVGVSGSVTGRRADGFIGDDLVKGRADADSKTVRDATWEWYKSDMRTRLKPGAFKIIIMTRWHEDDPAGRILPEEYNGETGWIKARDGEEWYVLSLQAECESKDDPLGRKKGEFLWTEWWGPDHYKQEKLSQGPRNWAALYQQRPAPDDGEYFERKWIKYYDKIPSLVTKYGASDYATGAKEGDHTVHGVMSVDRNGDIYITDWWREQTTTDVWIEELLRLAGKHKTSEWAEESGQILKSLDPFINKRQQETRNYFYRKQYPSTADKATRAQAFRGRLAQGKVYFPRSAPWVEPLISEMMKFTGAKGNVDDQVDVLSLFGRMLDRTHVARKPIDPPKPRFFGQGCTYNELFGKIENLSAPADGGRNRVRK
jgi:predicted phage terminase large subunit-like protein